MSGKRKAGSWKRIQKAIIRRDNGICNICKENLIEWKNIFIEMWNYYNKIYFDKNESKENRQAAYVAIVFLKNNFKGAGTNLTCGKPFEASFITIDHIIPKCYGGMNSRDNLRVLCIFCHKEETIKLHKDTNYGQDYNKKYDFIQLKRICYNMKLKN